MKGDIAMKKILLVLSIALVVAVICVATIFLNINQINLNKMMNKFEKTISKYSTKEIIELKGTYGKLYGNGNGIQYFGAALLEKNAVDDLNGLIAELDSKYEIVGLLDQNYNSIDIKYIEHEPLSYASVLEQEKDYITVFFFISWYKGSNNLDLRGH